MPKKIVVAIDSFKGCLTSKEANEAAASGVLTVMPDAEVVKIPVSDGGEGWLDAFGNARDARWIEVPVRDPLMRRITAQYLAKGDTAVIEMARASGLMLVAAEERNPMVATSYGTGQLVADAVRRGYRHIVVGLGGSATSDCGIGMLRAINDTFAPQGSWGDVRLPADVRFTIATDVTSPLCGKNGAARVFAPQKGATPEMVERLEARARRFATVSARHFGYDCQDEPGAGAAGGLGYAFLQYLHAERRPGIEVLFDAIHFDLHLRDADLVITGEGAADRQTLMGKLPFGVLQRAKAQGVPVVLIAGHIADREVLAEAGFARVECINPAGFTIEEALIPQNAQKNIREKVGDILTTLPPANFCLN